MFQNISQGPGAGTYSNYTIEILIMLLVAFLLGLLFAYLLWHRYKSMNVELQAHNEKQKHKLGELGKDHASLKYQFGELEKDNNGHKAKIRSLEADYAILEGKMRKLETSLAAASPIGAAIEPDDLKKVEGIGPKIEGLLNDSGIHTWAQLAVAPIEKLQKILADAGKRYQMHDPGTWCEQAKLAEAGKWEELEKFKDYLVGGKHPGKKA